MKNSFDADRQKRQASRRAQFSSALYLRFQRRDRKDTGQTAAPAACSEENLKIYNACQTALKIIGEVSMNPATTGVPPPVDDSWRRGLEAAAAP